MYTLAVSDHVMIAHSFADPVFGPAQRLHGATYTVDLQIRVRSLNAHDVVMDIGRLREILRETLQQIDYCNLDEHPAFEGKLSSTERVAEYLCNEIASRLSALALNEGPNPGGTLVVQVRESPVAYASYERAL